MDYRVISEEGGVKTVSLNIPVEAGPDGYFDRICPQCDSLFKVDFSEWSQDDEMVCPSCGFRSVFDDFDTEEMIQAKHEAAKSAAFNIGLGEIKRIFGTGSKNGFVTISIEYPPEREISPIIQSKAYRHNVLCGYCGCHYAVVGPAQYCPKCGKDTSVREFHRSVDCIRKILNDDGCLLNSYFSTFGEEDGLKYYQKQKESCICDLVSSFQFAAETIFGWFGQSCSNNLFQRIKDSNVALHQAIGHGYEAWITDDDIHFLNIMFNQRHLYEHHGGIVDQKYLNNTGDSRYSVDQRLKFDKGECNRLADLLEAIIKGMHREALQRGVSEIEDVDSDQ